MSQTTDTNIKVYITPALLQKLRGYIKYADGEVSGLGVAKNRDNNIWIEELFLFSQECDKTETTLDEKDVALFMEKAMIADYSQDLKLCWHSHDTMGVFWSGTDEETIEKFGNSWMLSIVGNKKGEFKVRLDLWEPFRVTIDDIPFIELRDHDKALEAEIEAEVKLKVKKKVYTQPTFNYFKGGDNYYKTREYTPDGKGGWKSITKEGQKKESTGTNLTTEMYEKGDWEEKLDELEALQYSELYSRSEAEIMAEKEKYYTRGGD